MTQLENQIKYRPFARWYARRRGPRIVGAGAPLSPIAIYRRAWREARGFRRDLLLVFALGLVGTPLSLLTPLPLKLIVDNVIGDAPLPSWLGAISALAPGSETLFALAIALSVALVALGL